MPMAPAPQLKSSMFGRMPVGGPKPPAGATPPSAAAAPKGVRIEHRIGIQAPAEVIWELIHDIDNWSSWNPLYAQASGQIRIGAPLELAVVLPGMKPQPVRATVLEWVPNEQLHYRIVSLRGLMKSTRYVEIEELAPGSCIVSNGEIMGGLLGPSFARGVAGKVHKGLRLMNEALKAQAEGRVCDR